ncbi:Glutamate receptor 2.7 [Vitis vinifera]|uniref:Glutamate receptor 2.7 n=1 Tax=Vitis vinifera TaxID=29760 RepID=A0A438HVH3_VITVI|nr:Glutamate receptor 2.7 [Vitis vinifera]
MNTWQQAALAAEIENQAQVPVLSLAASASVRPSRRLGRPTLIQMGSNIYEQVRCISAIVRSYHWRGVIAIYEDDAYGGNAEMLTLFSEALQRVGSEIEYHLSLPPISSLSDPRESVFQELLKLLSTQSRVFIVLQSSLPMATHLFQEARRMDFMGKDSAWIITDSISSFLDSMDTSVIPYMEGALGIKSYYSKSNRPFLEFSAQFQKNFKSENPEENNTQPGIHALRADDSIAVIARALERLASDDTNTPKMMLKNILARNFSGLSGNIIFEGGDLSNSNSLLFRIINVVRTGYKELDFWTQDLDNPFRREGRDKNSSRNTTKVLDGPVIWPGYLIKRVPKGWEMPTDAKPLKIGIPAKTSFDKFVKVDEAEAEADKRYSGFCIDIFREVLKILEQNYSLPYEFHPVIGTYDELVDFVYNKTYDAVVGDVTILANRSKKVEFTVPYAESGLVIVQVSSEEPQKAWMFLKPFTMEMWVVTGALLIYTMFIVWVLEYQSNNPAFRGPWKNQLGTALWFTFSSLFFAHREAIHSNITRVVIVVWLFVVFVLTSSYTASLSSILTVRRLESNVTDVEWLKATKSVVGCDGDSFSGNISAAFLELPYAKVFINQFCKNYTANQPLNRFGGLGFVSSNSSSSPFAFTKFFLGNLLEGGKFRPPNAFQKGSPLAADVSKAILTISEKGILKSLEDKWFPRSAECSTIEIDELSLRNFWALYFLCGATSTLCFLLFFLCL